MGRSKSHRHTKTPTREAPIENTDKLAERLYRRGLITALQAHHDRDWRPDRRPRKAHAA